jgi:hypothetical protein
MVVELWYGSERPVTYLVNIFCLEFYHPAWESSFGLAYQSSLHRYLTRSGYGALFKHCGLQRKTNRILQCCFGSAAHVHADRPRIFRGTCIRTQYHTDVAPISNSTAMSIARCSLYPSPRSLRLLDLSLNIGVRNRPSFTTRQLHLC